MSKQVVTLLRDDLDGSEATRTVVFAWEGTTYEIDLSDENFGNFSTAMSPYLGAARKRPKPRRSRVAESIGEAYDDAQAALAKTGAAPRGTPNNRRTSAPSSASATKKASARRGRVAESIVEAYDDAQAALAKTGAAPRLSAAAKKAAAKKAAAAK
jgi:Lsr2